jgi:membrane protease YdiL (CAAX protease family)
MHVTSVVFCVAHVIVNWQAPMSMLLLAPVWLFMGYAYAVIVRTTGSLWGPVLSHAIANVIYMYAYFALG